MTVCKLSNIYEVKPYFQYVHWIQRYKILQANKLFIQYAKIRD